MSTDVPANLRMVPGGLAALVALFGLSGFAGLIYESIWTHYLKLFLGHAAYAQSLVLAIFMAGMALGSGWVARRAGRITNLLRGYAIAEAAIGLGALLFHDGFVAATELAYDRVLPAMDSAAAAHALRWAGATAAILPQSVLLGMTFPLMSGAILRRYPVAPGRALALLYFSNSLGAVVGVLASGMVLIAAVGLPGTMAAAGACNLLLALVVWALARDGEPAAPPSLGTAAVAVDHRWPSPRLWLVAAALTGCASFFYEIAWIRMLTQVLGGATHSFELMLAAFILGLALGAWLVRRWIDRVRAPLALLAAVQLVMGLCALTTLWVYGQSFGWMAALLEALARNDAGFLGFSLASGTIALAVMLPATVCAGMTLPVLTVLLLRAGYGERSIGAVYAANTVGAIVATLAAAHVLMPLVGVKGVLVAGAAIDLGLGVALLFAAPDLQRLGRVAAAGAAGALVVAIGLGGVDPRQTLASVFRTGQPVVEPGTQVLFHRDGKTATVGLVAYASGLRAISTNGKPDAGIAPADRPASPDEATMTLLGVFGLAHHPAPRTAAVIGFGSGMSTHVLLGDARLERVDTVEIERHMVEAARGFGAAVERAHHDPRSHVHIEDAKAFFALQRARYDVIVSEPSNPWVSGVASLFSTEFYRRVQGHLAPGGLFVQWIQAYEADIPLLCSILGALDGAFGSYVIYLANHADLIVVARADGDVPPLSDLPFAQVALAQALGRVDIRHLADLRARAIAGPTVVRALLAAYQVPVNSDYAPYVDQNAARVRFGRVTAKRDLAKLGDAGGLALAALLAPAELPSPVTAVTALTPSVHLAATTQAEVAARLRDVLVAGAGDQGLPPDLARALRSLRWTLHRCQPSDDAAVWLGEARRLATTMLPWLEPLEAERAVTALWRHPCVATMPRHVARWGALLRAVARRLPAEILPAVGAIASAPENATDAEGWPFARRAGVIAALRLGRLDEARGLLATMAEVRDGRLDALPIEDRILVALASGRAAMPRRP